MKIDLCEIFGVEEGEEFKIELDTVIITDIKYRIMNNVMEWSEIGTKYDGDFKRTAFYLNDVNKIKRIIKTPKQFTDDELCILRNIDKEFKWICMDKDNYLSICEDKPLKTENDEWYDFSIITFMFNNLFQQVKWEDEEPICIDDYVER